MANMYYTENPNVEHDIHELNVKLLGESFSFLTDAGVFSKRMIDYGSQVLLNSLHFEKNKSLLDLGCGYGPLGISLAKVQGVKATMVDINTRALELAKKNATRNGVVVEVFQFRAGKQVVHSIIEESICYLNTGGSLTIVIQKKQGAPSAKAKMLDTFGNCDILKKDKGYYILRSEKV